jgi:hypothetical protein
MYFSFEKEKYQKKTAQKNLVVLPFSPCSFWFFKEQTCRTLRPDKFGMRFVLKVFARLFQKAARIQRREALVARRNGRNTQSFKAPERVNFASLMQKRGNHKWGFPLFILL